MLNIEHSTKQKYNLKIEKKNFLCSQLINNLNLNTQKKNEFNKLLTRDLPFKEIFGVSKNVLEI